MPFWFIAGPLFLFLSGGECWRYQPGNGQTHRFAKDFHACLGFPIGRHHSAQTWEPKLHLIIRKEKKRWIIDVHFCYSKQKKKRKMWLVVTFSLSDSRRCLIWAERRMYTSSSFYSSSHPSMEEQVELARQISHSLSSDTNSTSKGQSMYVKRRNRSSKWIHEGIQEFSPFFFLFLKIRTYVTTAPPSVSQLHLLGRTRKTRAADHV